MVNLFPSRRGAGSLLLAAGIMALSSSAGADSVWVRVNAPADEIQSSAAAAATLTDYGAFAWGRVTPEILAGIRAAGLPMRAMDNPFELDLGGVRFDPLLDGLPEGDITPRGADPAGDLHLVQFEGPVRSQWVAALRATGVEVMQPIYPFSYVVWASAEQVGAARAVAGVRWTGPMSPLFKVQPHLRNLDPGLRPTMALISRHAAEAHTTRELENAGATVHEITPVTRHFSVVHMDVPGDRYLRLADLPAVYTVQYIPPEVDSRGEMSNQSVVGHYDGSNTVFTGYADWLTDTGYDGDGVIVGIVDGGIRNTHQDLVGRDSPCVSGGGSPTSCTSANDGHGTHVAGAVAGTGASGITDGGGFLRGQGVAPGARVIEQRYPSFTGAGPGGMIPNGMLTIFRESALSGAVLTNNSWGPTGSPQGYDIPTQQIDIITRDALPEVAGNQGVLPVWSIMNGNGDSGGACAPSSVGSPDEAKNLFAVGSTKLQNTNGTQIPDIFDVSSNSGHGNACDGRRIPHIVAPGCYTDSTTQTSDTSHALFPYCGTSMASPVVSGAVSIFIERYRDLYDDATPSPALVKAAFTAVAHNLEGFRNADNGIMGHRPDRFQGYGRLDLDAVANPANPVLYFDQEHVFTDTGQEWDISISAANPSEPVYIMLAWTDAPGHGTGGTTPAWVNDLDLVVGAGSDLYYGNVVGADGWSEAGGDPDEMNNLEGVFLGADQHGGALNISVVAAAVSGDALDVHNPGDPSQDFALVCYNCVIGGELPVATVSPAALSAGTVPDTTTSRQLEIGNVDGGASLAWSIATAEAGPAAQTPAYRAPAGAARGMPQPGADVVAPVAALPAARGAIDSDFSENFDDITTLPAQGWAMVNASEPVGASSWFQGNPAVFGAHAGDDDAYIGVNFASAAPDGVISNWLMTPEIVLQEGTRMTFWTRTTGGSSFADNLQVRLSTAGGSTDVGSGPLDVGDFDTLLLEINEALDPPGYPGEWTEFTVDISGLASVTTGRIAFRYFLPDSEVQGNYIGIDTFSISQPEFGCAFPAAIPWLAIDPDAGTTPAGDTSLVEVLFDSNGLTEGVYQALLCVETNDPANGLIQVPVQFSVGADALFHDRFED